ncbi:RNA pseudouridine synthase [Helicobacter muridarum]|uniref:RNA pseudouridylate synthase n=1 Tax=Helicobacter muridarum TaxID=216 RepID=A0A099TX46_9HELI|nr:pseudouridine synthase [Helicobacter muridarum]TLD98919.1 RNA pseudouridine synthase [Helicobacter muridarum]STQ87113.1 ribosomal pseudouridine synthase [Helicobacter muridarum]
MGFVKKLYNINSPIKATKFLLQLGYSKSQTQRIIDKGRLKQYGKVLQKSSLISRGEVEVIEFVGMDLGLCARVVSNNSNAAQDTNLSNKSTNIDMYSPSFCIFNKPAKILTHPKNNDINSKEPSLLDQLRYSYGQDCNPCHRLDYETSGLVLCALDKSSEIRLKNLFLERDITKEYLAIVRGRLEKTILIQSNIIFPKKFGNLCIKGEVDNLNMRYLDKLQADDILYSLRDHHKANFMQEDFTWLESTYNNSKALNADCLMDFKSLYSSSMTSNHAISLFMPIRLFDYPLHCFLESCFGRKVFSDNIFNSDVSRLSKQIESRKFNQQLESYIRFRDEAFNNRNKESNFSLVRIVALTGRTHQLRIHANAIHHNIIGDVLYGVSSHIASFFLDSKLGRNTYNIDESIYDIQHNNDSMPHDNDIFHRFLYYCSNLPFYYQQILNDMRAYYTGSTRLLLHAHALNFLGKRFTTSDIG